MLDTETKRQIDDCRDILVGKLPDPKAQIEQITIGLIYKFMNDMDQEAIELGGKAKFFENYEVPDPEFPNDPKKNKTIEFEKYSWDKLFDSKVTASEMLQLYSEAIEGIELNPNIPQLFRDIFNNAYLPYRDPETLKLFLKTIDGFEYTHSEKLGDAFEYLLSVMGSQGDAGQFRTPRHIIDFLVAVVDPGKNDTILDPACGTAGFLISAFKHIKRKNNNELTPDERKKLIRNFVGYDISPDMVRLSLVNMYLHGFSEPHIHEYDTLSSEDRWNENFDVILANPPFMSPKGGIRPHKKFTINSNRSEVLFVDYIAEHLNPKGKAGVIVPEGVIFQSGTAYKELRKMLVDNYLYAVVSLPAGVFNPYSGVKTSILLMDNEVAKRRDEILFIKIDNDGYNLGAQRNAVKGSQLEEAIANTHEFVESGEIQDSLIANAVLKTKIAATGDYNLTGDRYLAATDLSLVSHPLVTLNEVIELESGSRQKGGALSVGIPSIGGEQIDIDGKIKIDKMKYISDSHFKNMTKGILRNGDVLVVKDGATTGKTGYYNDQFESAAVNEHVYIFRAKSNILSLYLYYIVRGYHFQTELQKFVKGIIGGISSEIKQIQIPLPTLSIQEEIVTELKSYQKIIDGAKTVLGNYKPSIEIDQDWDVVKLGDVSDFKNGLNFSKESKGDSIKILGVSHFKNNLIAPISDLEEIEVDQINDSYLLEEGDILFVRSNGNKDLVGRSLVVPEVNERISFSGFTIRCRLNSDIDPLYMGYLFKSAFHSKLMKTVGRGANIRNLSQGILNDIDVPIPPPEIQKEIVEKLKNEQILVDSNKELITIFEQKIKDRIAKVWGE